MLASNSNHQVSVVSLPIDANLTPCKYYLVFIENEFNYLALLTYLYIM